MRLSRPAIMIMASAAMACGQQQVWLHQTGTPQAETPGALALDGAGGFYLTLGTHGDFAGPAAGGPDVVVARYDPSGGQMWARQFGSDMLDRATLATDGEGVFVGGDTLGSLGGPHLGALDAWLARYNASGDRLWIQQFGGGLRDAVNIMLPDDRGGFLAGGFTQTLLGSERFGGWDAWLARFDAEGDREWITQFGSFLDDRMGGAAPDSAGGVFLAGTTRGDLAAPSAGNWDFWIARHDEDGNQLWIRQFGTPAAEGGEGLAPDSAGGVFFIGRTEQAGLPAIWLARFDADGDEIWSRQFTVSDRTFAGIAADGAGGFLLSGSTDATFGGFSHGGDDAWIARFTANGELMWIHQFGTPADDAAGAIAMDGPDHFFLTGSTAGDLAGPGAGDTDIFIARYAIKSGCLADCDLSGSLDFFDFLCFQNLFSAGSLGADCDGSLSLDFFDFLCFQNAFAAGCE